MNTKKWFLIPEEVVDDVKKALLKYIELLNFDSISTGILTHAKDTLHNFDTSLHITDVVPDDFKESVDPLQVYDDWGVPIK